MEHDEQSEKLNRIVANLLGRDLERRGGSPLLGFLSTPTPFDPSKPNIHDTKKEFQKELDAVESALESTRNILSVLRPSDKSDPTQKQMADRLSAAINLQAWKEKRFARVLTANELITKNAVEVGFFSHTLHSLLDFLGYLSERRKELKDQEKEFWSLAHWAPNYYARTIALRFARLVARETGERPKFGIARDGNHPSTDFGRALEEVYSVLGIEASVKNAAEWALAQLTEDDLRRKPSGLLEMLAHGKGLPPTTPAKPYRSSSD